MLYIGVTNDLARRLYQHRTGTTEGFANKYKLDRLVHVESFDSPTLAIAREKQLKGRTRRRKIALVESGNPKWKDLSLEWK